MIKLDDHGPVTILRLERGKGNALNFDFGVAFLDALDQLERKETTRAVVLTGKDNMFCAGVDLPAMVEGGSQYVRKYVPMMQNCFERLARFPKPVVAAVNGHAIAGGAILMFACDQRILAEGSARIGLTEVLVGVRFPAWALEVARFAIPTQHLSRVICTGRTFLPEESLTMGLVDELVTTEKLIVRSLAVAEEMAAVDPKIFTKTKQALRLPMFESAMQQAKLTDASVIDDWASEETLARVAVFAQKMTAKRS
jgi:enoyl-CoA hydratase